MIEIDDQILYNTKSKYLLIINVLIGKKLAMCNYELDSNEFSLSLLEKAYLKVYGGF